MTIEYMSAVLNHSTLSGTAKLILVGIANHHDEEGAWPSIETLARYGGISERGVRRAIAEAVSAGELEVAYNEGGSRKVRADRRPNLYRIHIECPPECDRSPQHRMPKPAPDGVTPASARDTARDDTGVLPLLPRPDTSVRPQTPRGDTGVHHGGTPVSAEPLLEPSEEQTLLSTAAAADESKPADPVDETPPAAGDTDVPAAPGQRMTMADYRAANPDRKHPPAGGPCPEGKPCVCRDTGNTDVGACFDAFWFWWPGRKAQKRRAQDAFARAQTRGWPADTLVAGAQSLAEDPNLPLDRQMIPLPAKWLDADGWLDDPYPPRTAPGATSTPAATPIPPRFNPADHRPANAVPPPPDLFANLRRTPRMSSQPPQVDTGIDEVTGSTWTAVQGDGGHVIITASRGCPPWLVTLAARQIKQQLMPGQRTLPDGETPDVPLPPGATEVQHLINKMSSEMAARGFPVWPDDRQASA